MHSLVIATSGIAHYSPIIIEMLKIVTKCSGIYLLLRIAVVILQDIF